ARHQIPTVKSIRRGRSPSVVAHLQLHPAQTATANRVVNDAIADGENVFVSTVVLAETSLVLSSPYRLSRAPSPRFWRPCGTTTSGAGSGGRNGRRPLPLRREARAGCRLRVARHWHGLADRLASGSGRCDPPPAGSCLPPPPRRRPCGRPSSGPCASGS